MSHILYGDGIHDDYPAIQAMLDSGVREVCLPAPTCRYTISHTLQLSDGCTLRLPRFAEIRLANGANCMMVCNRMVPDRGERLHDDATPHGHHAYYYLNEYSPTAITENIAIIGGVWNANNMEQLPNPEQTPGFGPYGYTGDAMLFYGVKGLTLKEITLKDPTHWGITLDRVTDFTVEDVTFDYNRGNPMPINMDGVHLNGNCHGGFIRNLKGACYDDMVALNAHEGSRGPITDVVIDGLYAEGCHSAVRLLTVRDRVENIHISNVFGTYYQYCIGLTKYYPGETTGLFDAITVEHVYAAKASREGIYPWPDSYVYPFLYLQEDVHVGCLTVADVHRKEHVNPVETVYVGSTAQVERLVLQNITTENHTGAPMPLLVNKGTVKELITRDISEK